jgi:hypothetical protein
MSIEALTLLPLLLLSVAADSIGVGMGAAASLQVPDSVGVGVRPPEGAIVLFDGTRGVAAARDELFAKWVDWRDWPEGHADEGWRTSKRNASLPGFAIARDPEFPDDTNRVTLRTVQQTAPVEGATRRWGYDDIETRPEYAHGDARVHVEWVAMGRYDPADPENPDTTRRYEPDPRTPHYVNSGVYMQNRYEIQIQSFPLRRKIRHEHEGGSLVDEYAPKANPGAANGRWQAYDIDFRAARWRGNKMTEPAHITVWWNGVLIHNDRAVAGKATGLQNTSGEEIGPSLQGLKLQSEAGDVRFRNIWIKPL